MDVLTAEQRRRCMARIRDRNTKPEVLLRKALWRRGFRYRLHDRSLPGTPDLVFPRFEAVVFVHGCFWHCHECALFKWPETRTDFWRRKIAGNRERDSIVQSALMKEGWRVLVVWECALRGPQREVITELVNKVVEWIEGNDPDGIIQGRP